MERPPLGDLVRFSIFELDLRSGELRKAVYASRCRISRFAF